MTEHAQRAVEILRAAGFVEDGQTRTENVRIPTRRAPVFGGTGGEARTLGGRSRFKLPGTDIRATVGPRTAFVYRLVDGKISNLGYCQTRDFTASALAAALAQ